MGERHRQGWSSAMMWDLNVLVTQCSNAQHNLRFAESQFCSKLAGLACLCQLSSAAQPLCVLFNKELSRSCVW